MTREEFQDSYAGNSGRRWQDLNLVALPCECCDPDCLGWAAYSLRYLYEIQDMERNWSMLQMLLRCSDTRAIQEAFLMAILQKRQITRPCRG